MALGREIRQLPHPGHEPHFFAQPFGFIPPHQHEAGSSSAFGFPPPVSSEPISLSRTWHFDSQPGSSTTVPTTQHPVTSAAPLDFRPALHIVGKPIPDVIDFRFSNLLKDPSRNDWMKLPIDKTFKRSPWLNGIYKLLESTLPRRQTAIPFDELVLSDEQIANLLPRTRFFNAQGDVYKMQVSAAWFDPAADEPMELLFRYHSRFNWLDDKFISSISFWSTTEGGSKLAFLGIFHISWTSWKKFVKNAPGVKFSLRQTWDSTPIVRPRLFLVPKPLGGS